jgi:hypothetical protein
MLTASYGGICWYAQDFNTALSRKHTHEIRLAHEHVSLVHVKVAGCREMDVDFLQEGTRAHVIQESMVLVRKYERRVRKSVCVHRFIEPQQRPGPELPTRCVVMVQLRDVGILNHLLRARRRIGSDLALDDKVAGQTPDILPIQLAIFAVKDEMPIVVFTV